LSKDIYSSAAYKVLYYIRQLLLFAILAITRMIATRKITGFLKKFYEVEPVFEADNSGQ
jgi:hypothetical protein